MDKQQVIKETAEKLLPQLGLTGSVSVEMQEDIAQVMVETEEGGMLIGYHGETLESFQTIVSLIASRTLGEFVRVNV